MENLIRPAFRSISPRQDSFKFHPFLLEQIQQIFLNKERFVFLETQRIDRENYLSYLFLDPVATITCFNLDKVCKAFFRLEKFLAEGYWAAGFFSYELGYGFEKFRAKREFHFPLIWLGVFKCPLIFDHRRGRFLSQTGEALTSGKLAPAPLDWRRDKYILSDIKLNENLPEYVKNIQRIKNYIAQGLTYQVNYTLKCKFKFQGSSLALYKNLRNNQPVAYAAFIKDRRFSLLSFSPELFFRKEGRLITVRPMKGTTWRGINQEEDRLQMKRLKASLKDRSENIMIVDLLRNDLGRISEPDSVRVTKLYAIEKYKTLFQMTSTIQAKLKSNLPLYELFRSLFPSGSVTGAPKIKTMEIIKQLEKEERRVYTGAVGFFKPNRDAVFNVAIRTLLLRDKSGEMGIGGGIVYDSQPLKEYKECKLKALFLTSLDPGAQHRRTKEDSNERNFKGKKFQLIETMRWSKRTGFFLLSYHLDRLRYSAAYFNFSFSEERIKQWLKKVSRHLDPAFIYRVRLLLSPEGEIRLNYQRIKEKQKSEVLKIAFAKRRTDSQELFLYYKTTNRKIYDREYQRAKKAGLFDVIFENEKGEITEGAVSNIFIRKGKMYYTPPVSCGLLNGTYRQYLIRKKAPFVKEKVLRRQDLLQADAIYLTNAVRGIKRVRLA